MSQLSSLRDVRGLGEWNLANVDNITWPNATIPGSALASGADIARSQIIEEVGLPITLPLNGWKATATLADLGAAAGTPAGALGITPGVHGTASPILIGESASGVSKTNKARRIEQLPLEYKIGGTLSLLVRAKITVAANTAQTIDLEVRESDNQGGVGAELATGAAQTLTTSWADYTFTITPTSLAAGDEIDIQLTAVANDTGGTAGAVIQIGRTQLLANIQG